MVLIRACDEKVIGVLRILSWPVPTSHATYDTAESLTSVDIPGRGRSHADMQAAFMQHQTTSVQDDTCWYSGAKFGRIAVSKDSRGQGCGRLLVEGAQAWVVQAVRQHASVPAEVHRLGIVFQLSSQIEVQPFYESLGFQVQGDSYMEEGHPHIWCKKSVLTDV